jgi:hypothetical protein
MTRDIESANDAGVEVIVDFASVSRAEGRRELLIDSSALPFIVTYSDNHWSPTCAHSHAD